MTIHQRDGFVISRIVHLNCVYCTDQVDAAIATAKVTGSIGATHHYFDSEGSIAHGATVIRRALFFGLRKVHCCQIRTSSDLGSPQCGKYADSIREGTNLWACDEHKTFVGSRPWQTPPVGVLPSRRIERVARWAAAQA